MNKRRVITLSIIVLFLALGAVTLNRLNAAKRQALSQSCVGHMTAICFSGRLWANDNGDYMPTNFTCMSNELVTPRILHCPGDSRRAYVRSWEEFTGANCSYEMITPSARESDTNAVFIRCTIHGMRGFADGSVFDGDRRRHKF